MGSVYKRGAVWWIAWVDGRGKQHARSSRLKGRPGTGKSQAAAKLLLASIEGDAVKGLPVTAHTGEALMTEALDAVTADQRLNARRDVANTERRITQYLAPYFTGYRLRDVTSATIRAYAESRTAASAAAATVNRELAAIRRALRLAARDGRILAVPHVALLHENNVRQGFVTETECKAICAQLSPLYAAVVEAGFITGWRVRSELLALSWSQIDRAGGTIRLDPGVSKGQEGRFFPITKRLAAILKARAKVRDGHRWVFHEAGEPIRPKALYRAWRVACAAIGKPDLILHDLRRSAVLNMERRGIPRQITMRLLGHRTESMYVRYAIGRASDIHEAGARLDAPLGTTVVRQSTRRRRRPPRAKRTNAQ